MSTGAPTHSISSLSGNIERSENDVCNRKTEILTRFSICIYMRQRVRFSHVSKGTQRENTSGVRHRTSSVPALSARCLFALFVVSSSFSSSSSSSFCFSAALVRCALVVGAGSASVPALSARCLFAVFVVSVAGAGAAAGVGVRFWKAKATFAELACISSMGVSIVNLGQKCLKGSCVSAGSRSALKSPSDSPGRSNALTGKRLYFSATP